MKFAWLGSTSRACPRLIIATSMLTTFVACSHRAIAAGHWDWNERQPTVAWSAEIGAGFAGVAVHEDQVVAFGNVADEDRVTALDADTAQVRWQYRYPCRALGTAKPDEPGPRATPLVHAGAVFTLSRDGRMLSLDARTGALRWWRDVPFELGERPPYWGFSGSPLVSGNMLVWSVGDHGLAVRPDTGEVVWKSTPRASTVWKNEPVGTSGYTTPQPVDFRGQQGISLANESHWVIVRPADGALIWSTPWEVPYGVTSAQPFLTGSGVVLSGGYGYGTRVIDWAGEGTPVWVNQNLRSHFANIAVVGEYLYGIDGNQQDGGRCELRCLRLSDGEHVWAREQFGFANMILVDGRLLVLTARGELVVVAPDPAGYRETGRTQVLGGESWTAPVLSGQRVFARNRQGKLVRVDLP